MPSTRMNIRGTNSARSAASSAVHGVVIVSSTTSEIDVATRSTMSPAAVEPLRVRPTGWPNHVPSGTTIVPVGDEAERRRAARRSPVKIGTNSQTRLTKNRSDRPDVAASTSVAE